MMQSIIYQPISGLFHPAASHGQQAATAGPSSAPANLDQDVCTLLYCVIRSIKLFGPIFEVKFYTQKLISYTK